MKRIKLNRATSSVPRRQCRSAMNVASKIVMPSECSPNQLVIDESSVLIEPIKNTKNEILEPIESKKNGVLEQIENIKNEVLEPIESTKNEVLVAPKCSEYELVINKNEDSRKEEDEVREDLLILAHCKSTSTCISSSTSTTHEKCMEIGKPPNFYVPEKKILNWEDSMSDAKYCSSQLETQSPQGISLANVLQDSQLQKHHNKKKEKRIKNSKLLEQNEKSSLLNADSVGLEINIDLELSQSDFEAMMKNINKHRIRLKFEELRVPRNHEQLYTLEQVDLNTIFVVDSNVLMTNLNFLEHFYLKRYTLLEPLILVIPWAVLLELKSLKLDTWVSESSLSRQRAERAVTWIKEQRNKTNTKVLLQSSFDLKAVTFYCASADDSILKCCLQLKMCCNKLVFLTNDLSMNQRANEINIYSRNIQDTKTSLEKHQIDIRLPKEYQISCNKLFKITKDVLVNTLTIGFDSEMVNCFGESWIYNVTPSEVRTDVFKNYQLHWSSIYTTIFPLCYKNTFRSLHKLFLLEEVKSKEEILDIIDTGIRICNRLLTRPYTNIIHDCIQKLTDCKLQCVSLLM